MIKIAKLWLTPNPYSRPQKKMKSIKGIALHWVGNPGTSAKFNLNFFESRKDGLNGHGSAHYIIGLEGEIIQCIPVDEMAYHVGAIEYTEYARKWFGRYPNNCLIGIEMCHLDWEGQFTADTLGATVRLCVYLCKEFDLKPMSAITTHNAITGKDCPQWFVDHPEDLINFRREVFAKLIQEFALGVEDEAARPT